MARWQTIVLPQKRDPRGSLCILEGARLPFAIQRLFTIYDVAAGESRGTHAHRTCHQAFIAMAGAFDLVVDDGRERETIRLQHRDVCLHAPPLIWCELSRFTPDAVCAVLASAPYDAADYIHDRAEFEALTRQQTFSGETT